MATDTMATAGDVDTDSSRIWFSQVALGLIGTTAAGYTLAESLHETTIGLVAVTLLVVATAVAYTGAYLTAAALDAEDQR